MLPMSSGRRTWETATGKGKRKMGLFLALSNETPLLQRQLSSSLVEGAAEESRQIKKQL